MHEKIHHTTPDGLIYPEKECPIYSTITDSSTHHSVNDVFWKKDGTSFFVQFDSTPMFNLVGHIVGTVVAFSDITLRKRAENEMRESETRYRALSNRLMEVQETERRHLALELHDELGGKLTALKLTIQKAQKLSSSKDQAEILTSGLDSIVNVLQQTRQISLELRPSMLDDLGLISALRWLTGRSAELGGLHVSFLEKEMSECIPKDVELTCYRVAQEALTNVLRHSNAKKVTVEIQGTDQGVLLVVADNGVGFDREKLQVKNILTKGAGLLGMEARVTAVGGKSFIHSVPDKGTEVCVEIPLSPGVPKQQRDKNKEEE